MAHRLEGVRANPESDRNPRTPAPSATRARLRFAFILAVAIAASLSFLVFPPQRHDITADGESVTLVSRENDTQELLAIAGIEAKAGDVLVQDGASLVVERAIPVVVGVDGQTLGWRTRARTVDDLLDEMDLSVGPYDGLTYNGVAVSLDEALIPEENINISIDRAVALTLVEDGLEVRLQSSREEVSELLEDAGIELGPADHVEPSLETPVVAGMKVEIRRARLINLQTGEGSHVVYTHTETLREALAEIGLGLGENDRVEPDLETEVTDGMTARLVRVDGQSYIEAEPVKRKTVFKPDASLSGMETRREVGADGVLVREFRIVIEDGVEIERSLVREELDPPPVDNVIYYAADAAEQGGLLPGDLTVVDTMNLYATWYNAASSGKDATHPAYGITRSGVPLTRGIVATDPSVIPLGTRLYIPGYGFAVAGDTGGGIIGDRIDLGFPDGVQVDWHTGWADVYILAP